MGSGGVPSGGVTIIYGKRGDLSTHGAEPNSRADLYVGDVKVQSRWYDGDGNVIRNRDYDHQDSHHNHEFPHDHVWVWVDGVPIRDKNGIVPDYDKYF